jgi:phosphohistidine phosphatase SixA
MQMLASSGITTIYTTEFRRTELLAAPLARQLGLRPQVVPAADRAALLKKLAAHAHGETVLVVGHSNTVPAVLKGLGHGELVRIDEGEFDNLFVLLPREGKSPAMLRLKY